MSRLSLIIPALLLPQSTGGRVDRSKPLKPKIIGYYTQGKQPNWTRLNEYQSWKDHVRDAAEHLELPDASREQPVRLDAVCYFPTRGGSDPENVRKGIVDALFKHREGGDRWVYGYHHFPQTDAAEPHVEVTITWGE